eukprot:662013-Pelagomonas_calceolata.AAC.3
MCASVWPGLDSEGILYFKDLTNPPVFLETLSTPCGTAGAVLPLALVLLYARTLSSSLAGAQSGAHSLLALAQSWCCAASGPGAAVRVHPGLLDIYGCAFRLQVTGVQDTAGAHPCAAPAVRAHPGHIHVQPLRIASDVLPLLALFVGRDRRECAPQRTLISSLQTVHRWSEYIGGATLAGSAEAGSWRAHALSPLTALLRQVAGEYLLALSRQ